METLIGAIHDLWILFRICFGIGDDVKVMQLGNKINHHRNKSYFAFTSKRRKEHEEKMLDFIRERDKIEARHPEWVVASSSWVDGEMQIIENFYDD